jgi:hypothetical protein
MLDNRGSMDARLATQMGITQILEKDYRPSDIQAVRNEYNSGHGHKVFATKEGLYDRIHLYAAQIKGFLIGCAAEAMIIVIFSVIN